MSTLSRTKTWVSAEVLTAADLNAEFDAILSDYNGGITNANIASGAAIASTKISGTAATLTGSETLTNKTLTAPTINTPTITSPVVSGAGGTTAGQQGYDTTNKAVYVGDGAAKQSIFTSAWKAYTPEWTNLTIGNAAVNFRYCQIGKLVHVTGIMTWGSGTSASGILSVSLPVTASQYIQVISGAGQALDSGTAYYPLVIALASTTTFAPACLAHGASFITFASVQDSVPMTWTTGDVLSVDFTYEAA